MKPAKIVLGVTAGDPSGIGPEVTLKALNSDFKIDFTAVVIARLDILKKYFPGLIKNFTIASSREELISCIQNHDRIIYDIKSQLSIPSPGKGSAETGLEAKTYIDSAVLLWKEKLIDAVVTGPVNKGLILESGTAFSGHTEYIAEKIGERNPRMMMFSDEYRVLLVTTHLPLSKVTSSINADEIYNTITIGYNAISSIDGKKATLAIAGLDPHCGEHGAIGDFDMKTTEAAVKKAKNNGIDISGPFPADTLFIPERWKQYNLVIAHYHDQGLTPFKMLAFDKGVNITLGLSIIRTSVDHGTAADIAGKNIADFYSMIKALETAGKLVNIRR